jgi:ribosomal protein L30/L7E
MIKIRKHKPMNKEDTITLLNIQKIKEKVFKDLNNLHKGIINNPLAK